MRKPACGSITGTVAGGLTLGGGERRQCRWNQQCDDCGGRTHKERVNMRRNRRMLDIDCASVIVIERDARRAVRAPVRMLDRSRVVVIVVVVLCQMDVRRRQRHCDNGRGGQQRGDKRPAQVGGYHAGMCELYAVRQG